MLALRRQLAEEGLCEDALHASKDSLEIRERVFALISTMNIRIDATILEKSKSQPQLRTNTENNPDTLRFYKYTWFYHFKNIAPQFVSTGDKLILTAAAIGDKKKRSAFKSAINDVVRQCLIDVEITINFWSADSDPCLQIADYCAWAIFQKWERKDMKWYNMINDKIHREYDLFQKGRIDHY